MNIWREILIRIILGKAHVVLAKDYFSNNSQAATRARRCPGSSASERLSLDEGSHFLCSAVMKNVQQLLWMESWSAPWGHFLCTHLVFVLVY